MARQTSHVIQQPDRPGPPKAARPRDPVASGERDAAHNRAAGHNYFLLERFEAGVALRGTEVKSIREGKANLKDAYGLIKDGEVLIRTEILPITTKPARANCCSTAKRYASYSRRRR
jgi:SsrA-binding protein